MADYRNLELRCSCSCTIARFEVWDNPPEVYVSFYVLYMPPTWWRRIKTAWNALMGRPDYSYDLVFEEGQIGQLRDYCDRVLTVDTVAEGDPDAPDPDAKVRRP